MQQQNIQSNYNGYIKEIFTSIQGEGKYAGVSQIFIRMCGCDIDCESCDTDYGVCSNFTVNNKTVFNPITVSDLMTLLINEYNFDEYHSISITGGEPLLQFDFLSELAAALREAKVKIFLETSGFYLDRLLQIQDLLDIISLDIKLESSFGVSNFSELRRYIHSLNKYKYYLKLPITTNIQNDELSDVMDLLSCIDKNEIYIHFIDNIFHKSIYEITKMFYTKKVDAYFIPQIHKLIGQR